MLFVFLVSNLTSDKEPKDYFASKTFKSISKSYSKLYVLSTMSDF